MSINILEARNNLSALIKQVEDDPNKVITISRRGVPVVDMVAHRPRKQGIVFGLAGGEFSLPPDWDMNEGDAEIADMMGA